MLKIQSKNYYRRWIELIQSNKNTLHKNILQGEYFNHISIKKLGLSQAE